ncbi:MAG: PorP/SprF family type IX secretion system membrane protein [Bacteroidota bacterium]
MEGNRLKKGLWGTALCLLLIMMSEVSYGQFYQFSQYYNTFQLLNPAFVGSSGLRYKLYSTNRLQWIGITENSPQVFQTYAFSGQWTFGHPLNESRNIDNRQAAKSTFWSMGLSGVVHNQGNGALKSTSLLTSGSVLQRIGEKAYIGGGIEVNFNRHQLDDFIFVNDYLNGDFSGNSAVTESSSNLSTGLILVLQNYWIGVSLKDMTTLPFSNNDGILVNETNSFYDNVYVHGGASFPLRPEHDIYFTSSFSYKQRRQNKQFDVGAGFVRAYQSGYSYSATVAYRGAGRSSEGLTTRDALIAAVGFNIPNDIIRRVLTPKGSNPDKFKDRGSLGVSISSDIVHTQFNESARTWEFSLILNAPSRKGSQSEFRPHCEDYLHGPLAEQLTKNLYAGLNPYVNEKRKRGGKKFSGEKEGTKDIKKKPSEKIKKVRKRKN